MRGDAPDGADTRGQDPPPAAADPPATQIGLVARLAAEPHLLARWAADAGDPRLQDAYRALYERVPGRIDDLLAQTVARSHDATRVAEALSRAVERHQDHMGATTAELNRLKWLLAGRRDRLHTDGIPGYDTFRADEEHEADTLEGLIIDLTTRIC